MSLAASVARDEGLEFEIITPGIKTKFDWADPRSRDHHLVSSTNYQNSVSPAYCGGSVSRVAWNLGDDPWWTLGGGTDAFGAGVGVSLEGGDELGHLLVALDAAE